MARRRLFNLAESFPMNHVLVSPGVWLVKKGFKQCAAAWFGMVSPLVVILAKL